MTEPAGPSAAGDAAGRTRSAHWRTWRDSIKVAVSGQLSGHGSHAAPSAREIPLRIDRDPLLTDQRRGHPYVSNAIRTARYTLYDFFPKQLFFQLTRLGNFYFLCVGIPQTIPGLSTTGNFTTILPLMFFILLTIVKEGYDDYKRHRLDKLENARLATVLRTRAEGPRKWFSRPVPAISENTALEASHASTGDLAWLPACWKDIRVGDIIQLSRDEAIPADIVVLHADGENQQAYIETMALDGETNLKAKQAVPLMEDCGTIDGLGRTRAIFTLEPPNRDLYRFDGRVVVGEHTVPVTLNEVIYRGCVIRNTRRVVGLVINTGEECKIRLNANQHPKAKKPALESVTNRIVLVMASYVVCLSVGLSMGYLLWQRRTEQYSWYLQDAAVSFVEIIVGFAIQFNNVIPLALYVSLEIVKLGQMMMLNSDMEMYDEASDNPARCNTNTILENLGQIEYLLSDKTGTLTENVLKFRKMSVAGTTWLHEVDMDVAEGGSMQNPAKSGLDTIESNKEAPSTLLRNQPHSHWRSTGRPDNEQPDVTTADLVEYMKLKPHSPFTRKAREYLFAIALCHTCLPEVSASGAIDYQAASPDELALVRAARELGVAVMKRTSRSITLRVGDPEGGEVVEEEYEILGVIEFTSGRQRMSVIVRDPRGQIRVVCKGADSAMLPRLKLGRLVGKKATEEKQNVETHRRSETPTNAVISPRLSPGGRSQSFEGASTTRRSAERIRTFLTSRAAQSLDISRPRRSHLGSGASTQSRFTFLDDPLLSSEEEIFTRCFAHLDAFATEGLRTLVFGARVVPEAEYLAWKALLDGPSSPSSSPDSLLTEATARLEADLDLLGASAIEDKLQPAVAQTIDRLRRAGIRVWMVTGDKRETAVNIAHSARICLAESRMFVLDVARGGVEVQIRDVAGEFSGGEEVRGHSVVVIDGHTLSAATEETGDSGHDADDAGKNPLAAKLYDVLLRADSVVCCRASPAQKAQLVRAVRHWRRYPATTASSSRGPRWRRILSLPFFSSTRWDPSRPGLVLAVGDGANDLAMLSSADVGVGISGSREGQQAARVADYAIARFRHLQRLILVHGRWNYVRTGTFVLATFWKEAFFYLPAAMYQGGGGRAWGWGTGYTGTSLYESASLTVFNTLFTSLCVICLGIWEQDLAAETLLAVPELYRVGQLGRTLNMRRFAGWMFGAVVEAMIVWFGAWAGYGGVFGPVADDGLFAFGNLVFSIGVAWINWKLFILETHHKTAIVLVSLFVTGSGWWAWNAFLSGVYAPAPSPYAVRGGFSSTFGCDLAWWLTLVVVISVLTALEVAYKTVKRSLVVAGLWTWPFGGAKSEPEDGLHVLDTELWQELERDPLVMDKLRSLDRD